ncbi:hypothetical protein [Kribbella sp. CA-293567]|uniref:hypothetical protein n=1 Tax=Kribbella sp. CA-293567 TaxID=3002436 RepID=UPI0022DE8EE5|nr:hypothetical protein [Kribbella sp. CA-293567]WBQ07938.1 hypothetical protein OX958_14310 [Kribbella sp. CA-293567]
MTESVDINGHRIADLAWVVPQAQFDGASVCFRCGEQFQDRFDIEDIPCPRVAATHGHELVRGLDDDLLYCRLCPLVAYDLPDVMTDPRCPLPVQR